MQLEEIIRRLAENKIPSPRLEARMILDSGKGAKEIIEKRINGWPLDKLLGQREFYKYSFFTDENVLSPRPDTEVLVEKAISLIQKKSVILDLGTGSGCILLSILKEYPDIKGIGIDKSIEALAIAEKNAKTLNIQNVKFQCKDWFTDKLEGQFDIIVSNPPYIPSEDIKTLDREVREHDPLLALDGGIDGLESYRKIAEIASHLLKPNGYLLLEIGINQTKEVSEIFTKNNFTHAETLKDLAGIDRCLLFRN